MNKILQNFYRDAYHAFEGELISNWAVDANQLVNFASVVKPIYKRQLSLACVATIAGLRAPRNEYAKELVEASYLSLVLGVKGLENCACVLVRQSIELALKHIYFAMHPVEYGWAATREGYREPHFHALLEYVKRTDEYREFLTASSFDLCERIDEKFGVLSRYVHMQSKRFMSYRRMNVTRRIDATILRRYDSVTAFLWPSLTTMLLVFFSARFDRARESEKRLIRSILPNELKVGLGRYMRKREGN